MAAVSQYSGQRPRFGTTVALNLAYVAEFWDFTGPDGAAGPHVQPVGRWPWVTLLLGVVIVVLGGILLSPDADIDPAGTMPPTVSQHAVR